MEALSRLLPQLRPAPLEQHLRLGGGLQLRDAGLQVLDAELRHKIASGQYEYAEAKDQDSHGVT